MQNYIVGLSTLRAFIESESAFEVCRRLVYPEGESVQAKGAGLHLMDASGKIRLIAHFGQLEGSFTADVYSWDQHLLSEAASTSGLQFQEIDQHQVVVIPLRKNFSPIGMLSLFMALGTKIVASSPELISLISGAGARFIDTSGLGSAMLSRNEGFEEWKELTERQLQVLAGMSQNMTNAEISRQLLLSESTIRQETVKIYRALQVSGRIEAAKKARALGLIMQPGHIPNLEAVLNT